ncbi:hypothetical protein P3X46_011308 [Hevea brasiliensis]|uniref:Uncharacterized protein n=1 Tax=Hevea brasiliensis TaxID=3981 RepID=A0ABQ9MKN0_HEVBR|nr:hypothetical protein P3X46_011308 [Hevea brasiliensis]
MANASPPPSQLPPQSSPEHTPLSPKSEPSSPRSPRSPSRPAISLQQPTNKIGPSKSAKLFRLFRAVFRSFPIITPTCKIPLSLNGSRLHDGNIHGGTRMTGTLFGHRKARINLAIQENPSSLPILLLELTIPTGKLFQDMGMGLREPTDENLIAMQVLHVISMGAGVIPDDGTEQPDGEQTYMRAHFERVIGSKDSETYYMMNPDGNNGPELTIFFVRI